MCAICGCGSAGTIHDHGGAEDGEHEHVLPDGQVLRHRHAPLQVRTLLVERDLLADNDAVAAHNRFQFAKAKTLVVNLLASPGAGSSAWPWPSVCARPA